MQGCRTSHARRVGELALLLACTCVVSAACSSGADEEAGATTTDRAASTPATAEVVQTSPPALPATGGTDPEPPAASGPPSRCASGDVTVSGPIRVWHSLTGAGQQAIEALVGEIEAADPSIDIELVGVEGGYDAVTQRLSETAPGDRPDVVMASNTTVRLQADSQRFVPVVECTAGAVPDVLGDLLPVVAATYTVDGTLWAAPFNVSTPVLVYDEARWERAGLDPRDPPSDHAELDAAIRTLRDSGEAATGIVMYDRSAGWLITATAAQRDALLATPTNGHGSSGPLTVDLAEPAVLEVLTRFQRLRADGYVKWLGWDNGREGADDLLQLINPIEPSGMTLHTSAALGALVALKETEGGVFANVEVGVAPFPGPGVGAPVGGGAWWLVDSGDPARVAAAWRAVERMLAPEMVARFAATTGYVPTTTRAANDPVTTERWADYPFLRVAYDQLAAATGSPADVGLQVGPGPQVDREIELAAAFTIDAGNDAATELAARSVNIADLVEAYRATVNPG